MLHHRHEAEAPLPTAGLRNHSGGHARPSGRAARRSGARGRAGAREGRRPGRATTAAQNTGEAGARCGVVRWQRSRRVRQRAQPRALGRARYRYAGSGKGERRAASASFWKLRVTMFTHHTDPCAAGCTILGDKGMRPLLQQRARWQRQKSIKERRRRWRARPGRCLCFPVSRGCPAASLRSVVALVA